MGKVWKYGDDVNTDVIFPGKYTYTVAEPEEMAKHALEDLDPEFAGNVHEGDAIVAGKNFGCGSSREQAASCLKYAGVEAIIAKSFARIFYRNAINFGLPAIVCPEAARTLKAGDSVEIDIYDGGDELIGEWILVSYGEIDQHLGLQVSRLADRLLKKTAMVVSVSGLWAILP